MFWSLCFFLFSSPCSISPETTNCFEITLEFLFVAMPLVIDYSMSLLSTQSVITVCVWVRGRFLNLTTLQPLIAWADFVKSCCLCPASSDLDLIDGL